VYGTRPKTCTLSVSLLVFALAVSTRDSQHTWPIHKVQKSSSHSRQTLTTARVHTASTQKSN
jgi:hypothetical protein